MKESESHERGRRSCWSQNVMKESDSHERVRKSCRRQKVMKESESHERVTKLWPFVSAIVLLLSLANLLNFLHFSSVCIQEKDNTISTCVTQSLAHIRTDINPFAKHVSSRIGFSKLPSRLENGYSVVHGGSVITEKDAMSEAIIELFRIHQTLFWRLCTRCICVAHFQLGLHTSQLEKISL